MEEQMVELATQDLKSGKWFESATVRRSIACLVSFIQYLLRPGFMAGQRWLKLQGLNTMFENPRFNRVIRSGHTNLIFRRLAQALDLLTNMQVCQNLRNYVIKVLDNVYVSESSRTSSLLLLHQRRVRTLADGVRACMCVTLFDSHYVLTLIFLFNFKQ